MIVCSPILREGGTPVFLQRRVAPVVYLDHWAIRDISEDEGLAQRFVSTLKAKNGTLAVSVLSQVEFCGLTDLRQAHVAERFIEMVHPNLFFMSFNIVDVMQHEDKNILQTSKEAPDGDGDLLWLYGTHPENRGWGDQRRYSAKGFFSESVRKRDELRSLQVDLAKAVLEGIRQLYVRIDTEDELRKKARNPLEDVKNRPRATYALIRALLGDRMKDRSRPPSENDAIDLLHTVVPACYCDFVLLDKQWCGRVEAAREQLIAKGVVGKVAKVFSKADDGVNRFLDALEAFGAAPATVK